MIRVIIFLLFSLGLVADAPPKKDYGSLLPFEPLLDGLYSIMGDNSNMYHFDQEAKIMTWRYQTPNNDIKTFKFSYIEEEQRVSVYLPKATCVYSKKIIGSVIHLIINEAQTKGRRTECEYSFQLFKYYGN